MKKDYFHLATLHGTPLFLLDCEAARFHFRALVRELPGVTFYYALKALSHPALISVLSKEGCNFDLASDGEISQVAACGVSPSQCILSNPYKTVATLESANGFGVKTTVIDSFAELDKLAEHAPDMGVLIRVQMPDPLARIQLSNKFGCTFDKIGALSGYARKLNLRVEGLSFHVGSQANDASVMAMGLTQCASFMRAHSHAFDGRIIDIGGGFPVDYDMNNMADLESYCSPVRQAIARLDSGFNVVAEPGRAIAAPSMELLVSVIGVAERDGRLWYYLDDGIYGGLSGIVYDKAKYPITALKEGVPRQCILAGPTCDGTDVITDSIELPLLECGDLLLIRMAGAYSHASATNFNSFGVPGIVVLNDSSHTTVTTNHGSISAVE